MAEKEKRKKKQPSDRHAMERDRVLEFSEEPAHASFPPLSSGSVFLQLKTPRTKKKFIFCKGRGKNKI